MSEIVKTCKVHGQLTMDNVYGCKGKTRAGNPTFSYKCRFCVIANTWKRPCKIHGNISDEDRVPSGKCRICCLERWREHTRVNRDENRVGFNERQRLKREANPEKNDLEQKRKYKNSLEKYGAETLNEQNKARKFVLTIQEYKNFFIDQDNKCAICFQPETRIFKDRNTGVMKVSRLCLDHNHETGKNRGLLCHDCNTAIGKMKEDIQRLESAINYLKKHNEGQKC